MRATIITTVVAMMMTTATTPPMMAMMAIFSELSELVGRGAAPSVTGSTLMNQLTVAWLLYYTS